MKRAMQIRSAPTTEIHLFPFRPSVIFREIQAILVCIQVPDRVIVLLPGKQTVPSISERSSSGYNRRRTDFDTVAI